MKKVISGKNWVYGLVIVIFLIGFMLWVLPHMKKSTMPLAQSSELHRHADESLTLVNTAQKRYKKKGISFLVDNKWEFDPSIDNRMVIQLTAEEKKEVRDAIDVTDLQAITTSNEPDEIEETIEGVPGVESEKKVTVSGKESTLLEGHTGPDKSIYFIRAIIPNGEKLYLLSLLTPRSTEGQYREEFLTILKTVQLSP